MRIVRVKDFFELGEGLLNTGINGSFPVYLYPLLLLLIVGTIIGVIYFILRRRSATTLYLKDPLFDGPSRSFFGLLDVAVREHFSLFRDVAVADVICYSGTISPLPGKLRSASFDLLLCDRRKMLPRCAIVLVEKSNPKEKQTRQLRSFCDKVGLPLLVYETGGMVDVGSLRDDVYLATGIHETLEACAVTSNARDSDNETPETPEHMACETASRIPDPASVLQEVWIRYDSAHYHQRQTCRTQGAGLQYLSNLPTCHPDRSACAERINQVLIFATSSSGTVRIFRFVI